MTWDIAFFQIRHGTLVKISDSDRRHCHFLKSTCDVGDAPHQAPPPPPPPWKNSFLPLQVCRVDRILEMVDKGGRNIWFAFHFKIKLVSLTKHDSRLRVGSDVIYASHLIDYEESPED